MDSLHQERICRRSVPVTETGCWLWIASVGQNGYGRDSYKQGTWIEAHRSSFLAFKGPIPSGLCVCHKCDTPTCVNPDHLFVASHADNMRDMIRKGRNPRIRSRSSDAGTCQNGHVWDERNTYFSNGGRYCRACNRIATLKYRQNRRQQQVAA